VPDNYAENSGDTVAAHAGQALRDGLELCERGAREYPSRPAIMYFDSTLTYRECEELAHALATALREEFGVSAGDRVALMMQNVPQMAIALNSIWMLGAIVTPVNVMNKPRELLHQLNDSGATVIVCLESYCEVIESIMNDTSLKHIVTVSELDYLDEVPTLMATSRRIECPGASRYMDLIASYRGSAVPRVSLDPNSPALLSYTSGTTGLPKGAISTHRAVAHNATIWERWYSLGPDDVVVAAAPLFHITGLMGHFAASRAAAAPLMLSFRFDAGEILRLIERWRGTWIVASLTAYIALLEHPDLSSRDISSLLKCASGGAPVSAAVADRFEQATGLYLHNAYGMTETSSTAVLVPMGERAPVDPEDGALSIGVPVPGAEVRIAKLDSWDEAPVGEAGELLIRGPMVTPGYWHNDVETEKAIRDGWFRTGDVMKRSDAGWYWMVDRVKDMIISSGYKVWPREVEDVLYLNAAVAEASVVGVPDEYSGEKVLAFVVLKRGIKPVNESELMAHCRGLLANYKVPRTIEIVTELPKTASGKVLRRELRQRSELQR
jgi:long-chain acyl-CoA synthetase